MQILFRVWRKRGRNDDAGLLDRVVVEWLCPGPKSSRDAVLPESMILECRLPLPFAADLNMFRLRMDFHIRGLRI